MIYPTILCGGSGTRLWPSARSSFPKQFTQVNGADSLFQQTLRRVTGDAFHPPLFVTCDGYRFTVAEQAERMGASDARIILEPDGRNTRPAILAAALTLKHEPDAVMMCMPADHKIKNIDAFHGFCINWLSCFGGLHLLIGWRRRSASSQYFDGDFLARIAQQTNLSANQPIGIDCY